MAKKISVPISTFKAQCTRLLRDVEHRRAAVTVTRHGKPIAVLGAPESAKRGSIRGYLAGVVIASEDLTLPTGGDWAALET